MGWNRRRGAAIDFGEINGAFMDMLNGEVTRRSSKPIRNRAGPRGSRRIGS
ncbi:unnamed protein product, partial [marine sediment metagenome]